MPRNLYPDTTVYATCKCVHDSFRMVPKPIVAKICAFAFAEVSSKYREKHGMKFYEFEFISNHYHLLAYDRTGKISDFLQELNSTIARGLNAVRGEKGKFFADEPGLQTVLGGERIFDYAIYTLANAVAAGLVHKTSAWKGFNSLRLEYGQPQELQRPNVGIWSTKCNHANRKGSQKSGRAKFARRSKRPATAILMLDRPPIRLELSDEELRAEIRKSLEERETEIKAERGGKPALGMKRVLKMHWSSVPRERGAMFERRPTFATETPEQRSAMKKLRRRFLKDYRLALARWNEGERDVVFPAGVVRMRLRHRVATEPNPEELLLAA